MPKNASGTNGYQVTFSTKGSEFDTKMMVFKGGAKPSATTYLDKNDNAKDGPWSEVVITGLNAADAPYLLIGVGGADEAQGKIRITAQLKRK